MEPLGVLWLVPVLPFAGAAVNGLLGPRVRRSVTTTVALAAPGLSLLVGLVCLVRYLTTFRPAPFLQTLYPWTAGPVQFDVAFLLDSLSAVMLFVVTFVGFLIHVYSVGYMAHERGYQRYFVYLNLFMGAMLLLVLGANYLVMFVGWEGVGLCSYLLIGFYYEESFPPFAGKKAFLVNRIGDFAFLVGLFALVAKFGTLDFSRLFGAISADPSTVTGPGLLGMSLASFVTLCLFIGAVGKSAQIPLYIWLPDAMAGPTPVSALIHAATMVTAGVYMVVRSNVLYQLAPGTSHLVAIVGCATAIFAATIGLAQDDIKKVLAYSTVSQLGYMFLAAGVGAYSAAIFHLGTHAFFKALLFLGSGSVIHAMGGEQDMRRMGGLKEKLPLTYWTFLVATLAISGFPPFAGFFSKDEILHGAFASGSYWLWGIGLVTAALTAAYMFRAVFLTFHGSFRGSEEQARHLHESPPVMTVPLLLLAVGAGVAGWVGIPSVLSPHGVDLNVFDRLLEPILVDLPGVGARAHELAPALEWSLLGLSVLAAVGGFWLAWRLWGRRRGLAGEDALVARWPRIHRVLAGKYFVDELYDRLIVRPLAWSARMLWKVVDTLLIDGGIHLSPFVAELTGDIGRFTTTGNVRNYALYFFAAIVLLFWWLVSGP